MLAQLLHQQESRSSVVALRNEKGALVHTQRAIKEVFWAHLDSLNAIHGKKTEDHGATFLAGLTLPTLDAEERVSLDEPITQEELTAAIWKLNTAKSPGGNVLPSEFYHHYVGLIAGKLLEVFQEA
ncbi:hypothetical protein NDU88_006080 [Pleurodeles waltl]|uniref:Uncharacterized protein n=1 Tax=Pleurodeles waltl TaxID=8319 RepID=A0AAV7WBE8_PLEWA|nr:hypothetical protein NDU88_006080 [Pleurodeles waltl]